jgi:hypothetical protein
MNAYSDYELLGGILKALVSRDVAERDAAAASLKSHVEMAFREMSTERFGQFEKELFQVYCCISMVCHRRYNFVAESVFSRAWVYDRRKERRYSGSS